MTGLKPLPPTLVGVQQLLGVKQRELEAVLYQQTVLCRYAAAALDLTDLEHRLAMLTKYGHEAEDLLRQSAVLRAEIAILNQVRQLLEAETR